MLSNTMLVLNGKGGVLKTTLTAQLAGLAALSGWRVLAVDLDQQANLARDLGYSSRSDGGRGLYEACIEHKPLTPIAEVRPRLDVIAAGPETNRLYREVANGPGGALIPAYDQLVEALAPLASHYNLVIIDSPPGGEAIHLAAMTAARHVVIPTQPDQGSIDGLATVFRSLLSVRRTTNPSIEVLGVVLGPVPSQASRLRLDTMTSLEKLLGGRVHVFERTVRAAQLVAVHCRDLGLLVHEYEDAAKNNATPWYKLSKEQRRSQRTYSSAAPGLAEDYQQLATEILERFTSASEGTAA